MKPRWVAVVSPEYQTYSGADYYDVMLTFKPELKEVVDFWGLHPYPANNPPEKRPRLGVEIRLTVSCAEL